MKALGQLDGDERRESGQALNAVKTVIADAIEAKKSAFHVRRLMTSSLQNVLMSLSHRGPNQKVAFIRCLAP